MRRQINIQPNRKRTNRVARGRTCYGCGKRVKPGTQRGTNMQLHDSDECYQLYLEKRDRSRRPPILSDRANEVLKMNWGARR